MSDEHNPIYEVIRELDYGGFISHKDIERAYGVKRPSFRDEEIGCDADFRKADAAWTWAFLECFTEAKDRFLEDDRKLLFNVRAEGYRVVEPKDQTSVSVEAMVKEIRKATGRAIRELEFLNEAMLTVEQRSQAALARAKVASVATLATSRRAILPPAGKVVG